MSVVIRIDASQMAAMERELFLGRVRGFVHKRCRQPAFIAWLSAQQPAPESWLALWRLPQRAQHSEHDLALTLVVLAVCQHAGLPCGTPAQMLSGMADNEMKVKTFLSERGYFDFTAFDSPVYAATVEG